MTDFARLPGGLLNAFRSRFRRSAPSGRSNGRENSRENGAASPTPSQGDSRGSSGGASRTPTETSNSEQFSRFIESVREIVGPTAESKGYSDSIREILGLGHSTGEVVYKALRVREKKNPEDAVKIAAWGFLIWLDLQEGRGIAPPRMAPVVEDAAGTVKSHFTEEFLRPFAPGRERAAELAEEDSRPDPEAENEERARQRAEEMGLGEFAPFSEEEPAGDRPGSPS